jgi:hypothetical protein
MNSREAQNLLIGHVRACAVVTEAANGNDWMRVRTLLPLLFLCAARALKWSFVGLGRKVGLSVE